MKLFKAQMGDVERPAFVVAGGVAANATVRRVLSESAQKANFEFKAPPLKYCTDNAAMIALAGLEHFSKLCDNLTLEPSERAIGLATVARPRWPLDEVRAQSSPIHKNTGRKGARA